jgi:anti-anti-sigma factor
MVSPSPEAWLEINLAGPVVVVKFTAEAIADEFVIHAIGERLYELVEKTVRPRFLVDFSGVKFCSSSLLGKLIQMQKKTRAAGGRLVLCGLEPDVFEVLDETHLDRLLTIYPARQEALRSFEA